MKAFTKLAVVWILLTLAMTLQAGQRDNQVTLEVTNMVCSSCEMRIEQTISALAGVTSVEADASSNSVRVNFDSNRVTLEQILQASEAAGYPAVLRPIPT